MSGIRQKSQAEKRQLNEFWKESRRAFGEMYRASGKPSVLIAQNALEDAVEKGWNSAAEARALIRSPDEFAKILLKAECDYQNRHDQQIHSRMSSFERKADWKVAAAVSLGAGMITGVIFSAAGPFFSSWLQPTADEIFRRTPKPEMVVKAEPAPSTLPQTVHFITNNNYAKLPSNTNAPHKPKQLVQRNGSVCGCDRK